MNEQVFKRTAENTTHVGAPFFSLFFRARRLRSNPWLALPVILAVSVAALGVRFIIAPQNAGLQFVTFFPAITLVAIFSGAWAGMATTLICSLLASYFFFQPFGVMEFRFSSYLLVANAVFIADGIVVSMAIGAVNRALNFQFEAMQNEKALENEMVNIHKAMDKHSIIAVTDKKGSISYVNDKFCEISGYSEDELIGQNHRILNSGTHPREFFTRMYKTIASGNVWQGDICNKNKSGGLYWVATTIVPFMDINGVITQYIAIRTDITEKIKAEEKAREASMAKARFLANMSHEIRTPLNAISGLSRIAMEDESDPEKAKKIAKINKACGSLTKIVNEILDFSKLEENKVTVECIPLSMHHLINDAIELFEAAANEKHLKVRVETDGRLPKYLYGDPLRVGQIINNILSNAIKFSRDGFIDISTEVEQESYEDILLAVRIKDCGQGIEAEKIETLFTPFTQGDTSTTRINGGTGLGLSIVKRLVELMGGEISLTSEHGLGTTVTFTIKLKKHGSVESGFEIPAENLHRIRNVKLLIVDEVGLRSIADTINAWNIDHVTVKTKQNAMIEIERAEKAGEPYKAVLVVLARESVEYIDFASAAKKLTSDKLKVICFCVSGLARDLSGSMQFFDKILQTPLNASELFETIVNGNKTTQGGVHARYDGMRVLLVEDHPLNQEIAKTFMQRRGVIVDSAFDGAEAVAYAQKNAYDIIFMDLHMPVMGGVEASREIKKHSNAEKTPIVAMTASVTSEDKRACAEAGMSDFIAKPVAPEDITRVLARFSPQALPTTTNAHRGGDIENMTLNIALLERRTDKDKKLAGKLLNEFLAESEKFMSLLRAELQNKNSHAAFNLLHRMKGVSANVGAEKFSADCQRIINDINNIEETLNLDSLENLLYAAVGEIKRILPKYIETPRKPDTGTDNLNAVINEIYPYIVEFELVPETYTRKLESFATADEVNKQKVQELLRFIDRYEYREARDVALSILAKK